MSGFVDGMSGRYTDTTNVSEALQQGILKAAFVGGQDYYECVVCHRSMAGAVPAEAHLKGSPHFKALRNYTYSSPLNDALTKLHINENVLPEQRQYNTPGAHSASGNTSDEDVVRKAMDEGIVTRSSTAGVTSLKCEVCNVQCTGEAPMAQHLDGEPHRKRQRRMGTCGLVAGPVLSRSSVSPVQLTSDYTSQTSFSSGVTRDEEGDPLKKAFEDGIVEQNFSGGVDNLTCKVCCKSCTGSVPMRQHLLSSAHIKKLRINALPTGGQHLAARSSPFNTLVEGRDTSFTDGRDYEEEGVPSFSTGTAVSSTKKEEGGPSCSIGPISSSTEKGSTAETDYGEMVIEVDGSLMCLVCQLQCTGKANMAEHLQGDHHRRKWRDQMDQLKMFGITPVTNFQPPPVSKPVSSQKVPSERIQSPVPPAVSQSNPSNQSSRSLSVETSIASQRTYGISRKKSISLPPNLSDLEVYFPEDKLGKNF